MTTTSFYVSIDFYREPEKKGNVSRYYFGGFNHNRVILNSRGNAKIYVSKHFAEKAVEKLNNIYHNASITI